MGHVDFFLKPFSVTGCLMGCGVVTDELSPPCAVFPLQVTPPAQPAPAWAVSCQAGPVACPRPEVTPPEVTPWLEPSWPKVPLWPEVPSPCCWPEVPPTCCWPEVPPTRCWQEIPSPCWPEVPPPRFWPEVSPSCWPEVSPPCWPQVPPPCPGALQVQVSAPQRIPRAQVRVVGLWSWTVDPQPSPGFGVIGFIASRFPPHTSSEHEGECMRQHE